MDVRAAWDRVLKESAAANNESPMAWDTLYASMFLQRSSSPKRKETTTLEGAAVQVVRCSYPQGEDVVAVYRQGDPKLPNPEVSIDMGSLMSTPGQSTGLGGANVDYKLTVLLNLVCEVHYRLSLAIVKEEKTDGQIKAVSSRHMMLYASPFHTNMVEKGSPFTCSFPTIYFQDHNHESDDDKVALLPGHGLCVELFSQIPEVSPSVLFRGYVSYKTIADRIESLGGKPGVPHFIPLAGPEGKGKGQLSVTFAAPLKIGPFYNKKDSNEPLLCSITFVSRQILDIVATLSASLRNQQRASDEPITTSH